MKYHAGSVNVKHKFNGHEYDGESGLYYMGARYYDPKLARFISADTIVPLPFYSQSLNRFSFTLNNPVVLRELNGNCFAAGAVYSASQSYTISSSSHGGGPSSTGGAVQTGHYNATGGGSGYPAVSYENGRVILNITNPIRISPSTVVTSSTPSIPSVPSIPSTPPNLNFGAMGGASQHGNQAGNVGSHNSGGVNRTNNNSSNTYSQYNQQAANNEQKIPGVANSQAGINNPFPDLPTFSEAFPNSNFAAPVVDIVVGGIEGGFAVSLGVASVVGLFGGPTTWGLPVLYGGTALEVGADAISRISTGIESLSNRK
ncbi:MAG: RHS repeat-associated core domain-containing protein [Nitrospiraceae bacterium]|nr:MAG: RHS repeat-associated core domain-containing protein [Nitrospiraceae bacterium]